VVGNAGVTDRANCKSSPFLLKPGAKWFTISVIVGPLIPDTGQKLRTPPLEYDHGKETILVVDDEESLRTVIVDLLRHLGYCTLSAANAHDAMKLAREYPGKIDLLLTDVVMHPLPGPVLAEMLMRSRPEMKVIYISGYANASLAPDGVLKPGTVLVNKPFTMKILSAKLREVLGNAATA
jgi:two-component system, cell cycle sensor histidine kinase and response regulator CckA